MKIYTRTGDTGQTSLFGGGRVSKAHPRVEAYGTVDELNAFLGAAVNDMLVGESRRRLRIVQHDLFAIGAVLAAPPRADGSRSPHIPPLPDGRVEEMEQWMDEAEKGLEPLRNFILPGGSSGASALHVARTVCRRAERLVIVIGTDEPDVGIVLRYLNRLSDLLFTLARFENRRAGTPDVAWTRDGEGGNDE